MSRNQKRLLAAGVVAAVLAIAFWYGGSAPGLQGWQVSQPTSSASESSAPSSQDTAADSASTPPDTSASTQSGETPEQPVQTGAADKQSPSAPPAASSVAQSSASLQQAEGSAQPPEESGSSVSSQEPVLTCTLSIRCNAILEHLDWLNPDKSELVPADGVILAASQTSVPKGETVFNLLQSQTRAAGIQMEASFTPGYGSSYVEGIANLYEFDCGQQSGWTYLVNGVQPGYGSSQYVLSDGDVVEWVYTCNLGKDAGAEVSG